MLGPPYARQRPRRQAYRVKIRRRSVTDSLIALVYGARPFLHPSAVIPRSFYVISLTSGTRNSSRIVVRLNRGAVGQAVAVPRTESGGGACQGKQGGHGASEPNGLVSSRWGPLRSGADGQD
ncbi:hypothetical protein MRX96_023409 [Rhipicephalus microplus]